MNIEKLMNIRGIIEQELANERVTLWCYFGFKYENMPKDSVGSIKEIFDSCGTMACIAGWTILTYKPDLNFDYTMNNFHKKVFKTAQDILELTDNEAIYLFKAGLKQDALTRFDNLLHASTFKGE